MTVYFFEVNQSISLYQKSANKVFTTETSDVYTQFQFAVERGSVGFQAESKDWVQGGVKITNGPDGWKANLSGVFKVELFEMHESQLTNKTPIYIDGFGASGSAALVASVTEEDQNNVDCQGEAYPKAELKIGKEPINMVDY